jgi:hypothetical protein
MNRSTPIVKDPLITRFTCEVCRREMKQKPTLHHLIPRTCHKNSWFQKRFTREEMRQTIQACCDCHKAIHRLIPREKELGRHFHSLELLLSDDRIAKFVAWVRRQK